MEVVIQFCPCLKCLFFKAHLKSSTKKKFLHIILSITESFCHHFVFSSLFHCCFIYCALSKQYKHVFCYAYSSYSKNSNLLAQYQQQPSCGREQPRLQRLSRSSKSLADSNLQPCAAPLRPSPGLERVPVQQRSRAL